MSKNHDLGPLRVENSGNTIRFTLTAPNEMTLDLPPNYETQLAAQLPSLIGSEAKPAILMDLQNIPAISSRQLGVMLALHKALRTQSKKLKVTNTSPGVRHLFAVTRTAQFFELI